MVRDPGAADVGIFGGERVWRGECTTPGQRVEEGGFPCVGQTDESEAFHAGCEASGRTPVTAHTRVLS